MSELNYNPGAEALFEKPDLVDFVSRKDEDMSKYPLILSFPDQSMFVYSKKDPNESNITKLIKKYGLFNQQYSTRGSRPIVVECIKEGNG